MISFIRNGDEDGDDYDNDNENDGNDYDNDDENDNSDNDYKNGGKGKGNENDCGKGKDNNYTRDDVDDEEEDFHFLPRKESNYIFLLFIHSATHKIKCIRNCV